MRQTICIAVFLSLLSLLALPAAAENEERDWRPVWKASSIALMAASMVDTHSSLEARRRGLCCEVNPLLRDRDGQFAPVRGTVIKVSIPVTAIWLQKRSVGRNPRNAKKFALVNIAISAALGAVAAHNYRLGR